MKRKRHQSFQLALCSCLGFLSLLSVTIAEKKHPDSTPIFFKGFISKTNSLSSYLLHLIPTNSYFWIWHWAWNVVVSLLVFQTGLWCLLPGRQKFNRRSWTSDFHTVMKAQGLFQKKILHDYSRNSEINRKGSLSWSCVWEVFLVIWLGLPTDPKSMAWSAFVPLTA